MSKIIKTLLFSSALLSTVAWSHTQFLMGTASANEEVLSFEDEVLTPEELEMFKEELILKIAPEFDNDLNNTETYISDIEELAKTGEQILTLNYQIRPDFLPSNGELSPETQNEIANYIVQYLYSEQYPVAQSLEEVLTAYSKAVAAYEAEGVEPEQPWIDPNVLLAVQEGHSIEYVYYDINGDGKEELIFRLAPGMDETSSLFAVFALAEDESGVYPLVPLNANDNIWRGYITQQNDLILAESDLFSPADNQRIQFAQMSKSNKTLDILDEFVYDGEDIYREYEPDFIFTQEEVWVQLGFNEENPSENLINLNDWNWATLEKFENVDPETTTAENVETTAEEADEYPFAVDLSTIEEGTLFYLDGVNVPNVIELYPEEGFVVFIYEGLEPAVFNASFVQEATMPVRTFNHGTPDIREVNVNTTIYVGDMFSGNNPDFAGDVLHLIYNNNGTVSLLTPNYAGNVELEDVDVMLEYLP